ncbi:SRPBCC family protein [Porphyrobacter sp. YT40]|uniref:SRPBCC family protein n=1 Tax=Porphyrobacter sp. YT40 TaxID=2547601 RepID=UPI0015E8DBB4|nr:SRPBCC family protein [Porphyrobacter sp. YT40]
MKPAFPAAAALAALLASAPVSAEITGTTDDSFVSRHEVVVEASPKEVWLALISPADWWRSEHTWSGDSKNLSLMPTAGGCFCETIPEVDEPGRFTLEGSVEHMRVVQAYPETALRMVGALGPLQSEPVTGVLTIAISKTPKGTKIVWEYNVGGPMRYELPVISKAVDGVMGAQLEALAKPLKVVPMPKPSATPAPAPAPAAATPAPATGAPGGAATKPATIPAPAPATGKAPAPAPAAKPAPKVEPTSEPKPAAKTPSVAETFGDLGKPPRR